MTNVSNSTIDMNSYVAPNESTKIPESIEVNHEEETSLPTQETSSPTEETSLPTEETSPPTEETSSPIEETSMQHDETTEQSQKQEIRSAPQTKSRSDVDTNTVASTSKRGFSETLTPENESISDNTTGPILFVKPKDAVAKKLRAESSLKLYPEIDKNMNKINILDNIDLKVRTFTNTTIEAAHSAIGKTKLVHKHNPVSWWNQDCEKVIKESKQAFNQLRRHNTTENLVDLKLKRARVRLTVRKSQKESWRKYVSTINSLTPISKVWKKIRSITGNKTFPKISTLKDASSTYSSDQQIADALARAYHTKSNNGNYDDEFLSYKILKEAEPILVELLIQKQLHRLEIWSKTSGLRFSAEKTNCIVFSKKQIDIKPPLFLSKVPLKYVDNIKFLGITFDERLTWKQHIRGLVHSCQKALNILKCLANKHWGSDGKTLLSLYRSPTRSKIDYGCIAYASASSSTLKQLDTLHNSALRLILGAFRTTPVDSLYCESGEAPLDSRRQILSLAYAAQVKSN
nr:unnamed protein product [Callosobruchus chinensis]